MTRPTRRLTPEQRAQRAETLRKRHERLKGPRYVVDEATGCWEWVRSTNGQGYPSPGYRRSFYEEVHGPYPTGRDWTLHHSCGNKACVNPDHSVAIPRATHYELHRRLTREWKKLPVDKRLALSRRVLAEVNAVA